MTVITFPDTVAAIIGYLDDNITPPVSSRIPNPRPATFVTVQRTGGPKRNLVTDQAQVTVDSWAATEADAHDLAQQVRGLINDLPGQVIDGALFVRVDEFSGPADLPDPLSDQPRYTQSFSTALRA